MEFLRPGTATSTEGAALVCVPSEHHGPAAMECARKIHSVGIAYFPLCGISVSIFPHGGFAGAADLVRGALWWNPLLGSDSGMVKGASAVAGLVSQATE
ncbi:hypothetical protein GCM10018781_76380 [Kitasatospora indigofera]|uniref:Uncharacterized protein n=1 Tax=Kitasatospora indigofera TaxID=67307 RepID=A0A919D8R3_9ACTN|nr:hypothetical protein GCM10018781_76380 [Kitasatospora indigofera]